MASGITTDAGLPAPTGDATALSAAQALIDQFYNAIDWDPRYRDTLLKWQQALVNHGLVNNPQAALSWLWGQIPAQVQKVYPGAEFGMTPDAYSSVLTGLQQSWNDLTGADLPHDVLRTAIQNNWTPSQLQTYVFDSVTKEQRGGGAPSWLDLSASPWLLSGVSFQSAGQTMAGQEPGVPLTASNVRNWWQFVTGARQLGGGKAPTQQDRQPPGKPNQEDTAVR